MQPGSCPRRLATCLAFPAHRLRGSVRPFVLGIACLFAASFSAAAPPRVLEPGKLPADSRLGAPRTYNDKNHRWTPPSTRAAWESERATLRERMLVGMG